MSLSNEQKSQIAQQLADGASIADIQRLIVDDYKIPMTYMEVRFLMDDLNLDLAPPPEPEPDAEADADSLEAQPAEAELVGGDGSVSVEMDKIKRPGAALSGSVTFSDGVSANWTVDPYGRLGLDCAQEGYQPSPEDIEAFQLELQRQMQGPAGL
ncbi:hypothetical protein [Pelagicoccus sp. SDUM812005]|uniref:hypothetical protein n=1 Tax=Pelagicoccus sp. SDUM812005 TaxID=3041257 RepID=UPI00280E0426|nr:hypothetical protein [Pelagicoccus sp. SDUM812005]MDQ8180685.1 hypothetical protein [Pelagicoccus sp. SDUM812005]